MMFEKLKQNIKSYIFKRKWKKKMKILELIDYDDFDPDFWGREDDLI